MKKYEMLLHSIDDEVLIHRKTNLTKILLVKVRPVSKESDSFIFSGIYSKIFVTCSVTSSAHQIINLVMNKNILLKNYTCSLINLLMFIETI